MTETSTLLDNAAQMRDYQENDRLEEEAKKKIMTLFSLPAGVYKTQQSQERLSIADFFIHL